MAESAPDSLCCCFPQGGDGCLDRRPDFGRPTRYEACLITQASLFVAFIFWTIGLYSACAGHGTSSVIENCLESFLDLASTAVVLFRLGSTDALAKTARNAVLEARVSVILGFTMILLGSLFISFATVSLADHDKSTADDVTVEAALAVPSAILYLVVGMLQLNMAWVLNLRSLMQDATISILGAVVAVGTLISALINLILWVDDPNGYDTLLENYPDPTDVATAPGTALQANPIPPGIIARAERQILFPATNASGLDSPSGLLNRTLAYTAARVQYHFQYWWLDSVVTSITACFLIFFGVYFLIEDTRDGSRWWTSSFWFAPLPPRPAEPAAEKTPLKAP